MAAALLALIAAPLANAGTIMKAAGKAFAPPAFYSFCAREPKLRRTGGDAETVVLLAEKARQLKEVNSAVNARIKKRSDLETVDKDDDWLVPTTLAIVRILPP